MPLRALHAGCRGDVDDVAAALRFHQRHDPIGDIDQAEDVGIELPAHLREIEAADLCPVGIPGIVDEHVDTAHALLADLDGSRVVVSDADIRPETVGAGLARDFLHARVVAPGEDDLMPCLPCLFDNCGANPLATAGY